MLKMLLVQSNQAFSNCNHQRTKYAAKA